MDNVSVHQDYLPTHFSPMIIVLSVIAPVLSVLEQLRINVPNAMKAFSSMETGDAYVICKVDG